MSEARFDKADIPASWKPAMRLDVGRLRKAERTASGGVRVPAAIAREGILEYHRADGTVSRELVPAEELTRTESLRTLRDAPVTVGHPDGGTRFVTPDSYRTDAVGHVSGSPRAQDGHVMATLAILDAQAIRRIDGNELEELSAGYRVFLDPTPGVTEDGQHYDAIQRMREYNHVALLPAGGGRAGHTVALRLDGAGDDIDAAVMRLDATEQRPTPTPAPARTIRSDSMKTERIDGVDYEVGSTAWAQARAKHDREQAERLTAATARADAAEKQLAELKAKVSELEAKLDTEKKRADEASDPKRLDARVAERAKLVGTALRILGAEEKLDGKTDREIKELVLKKLDPEIKLDGKDDVYVDARLEAELRHVKQDGVSSPIAQARSDAFGGAPAPGGNGVPTTHFDGRTGSSW